MHKLRKAAVLVAALSTVGVLGAGTAHADGGGHRGNNLKVQQSTSCKSHDLNISLLGIVGLLNGVLGNGVNGEGEAGSQNSQLGSTMGCNNSALSK